MTLQEDRRMRATKVYERCGMGPCANGVVWCSGKDEEKYIEVVRSY